jgi:hypothetical protein
MKWEWELFFISYETLIYMEMKNEMKWHPTVSAVTIFPIINVRLQGFIRNEIGAKYS